MRKQYIDLDKIREAVQQYETDEKGVMLVGIVCSVEPKNRKREFDDELGYGKFVLKPENFISEADFPDPDVEENQIIENTQEEAAEKIEESK